MSLIPSPHISFHVSIKELDSPLQIYSYSTVQVELHPSPLIRFPSSQYGHLDFAKPVVDLCTINDCIDSLCEVDVLEKHPALNLFLVLNNFHERLLDFWQFVNGALEILLADWTLLLRSRTAFFLLFQGWLQLEFNI